jgi:prepilin-type N-terminal cleavage/methylation domain-containing protein/prepilin-type processing-associated H-X9-DG protein
MLRFLFPPRNTRTRAFTLIELLVVIAIIAILIGLLLPAVQKVRAAAARSKCSNNLKQLALAVIHYADTNKGVLPPGGWSDLWNNGNWNDERGSWFVYTLPYMEQSALYNKITQSAGGPLQTTFNSVGNASGPANLNNVFLPYARCPSDDWNPDVATHNYVGSLGSQCAVGPCGYDPNQKYCNGNSFGWGYPTSPDHGNSNAASDIRGLFNRIGAKILFPASIIDGTSNTIMLGESLPGSHDHLQWAGWYQFNGGNSHCTTIIPINNFMPEDALNTSCQNQTSNWDISWGFRSRHTGGTQFAFADGSVHFLAQGINHRTYQLLGCRNDGQVPGTYE